MANEFSMVVQTNVKAFGRKGNRIEVEPNALRVSIRRTRFLCALCGLTLTGIYIDSFLIRYFSIHRKIKVISAEHRFFGSCCYSDAGVYRRGSLCDSIFKYIYAVLSSSLTQYLMQYFSL